MRILDDDMRRVLAKLEARTVEDGDRIYIYLDDENGERLFPPIFVRTTEPLPSIMIAYLQKALGLTEQQFDALFECTMTRSEYLSSRDFHRA